MIRRLLGYGMSVIAILSVLAPATPVHADAPCSPPNFLGMPAWYRGLQDKSDCSSIKETDIQTMILTIALNILQANNGTKQSILSTAHLAWVVL